MIPKEILAHMAQVSEAITAMCDAWDSRDPQELDDAEEKIQKARPVARMILATRDAGHKIAGKVVSRELGDIDAIDAEVNSALEQMVADGIITIDENDMGSFVEGAS